MAERKGKPELGTLVAGQDVIVVRSSNDQRRRKPEDRYVPARIVKVNRVWIEIESANGMLPVKTWRMRRDTQDQASGYSGSDAGFLTKEQHAWQETRDWALSVLRGNGIDLRYESRWRGREVELADLIAKAEEGQ